MELNDEQKELKMELEEMTQKYNELKKLNIDESKFMDWDTETVVDWMLSLDEEYGKYEGSLRENMRTEGVNGSLLHELEKMDLQRYGVVMLKDRVAIIRAIEKLTSQIHQQQIVAPPAAYQPQQYQNDGPNQTAFIG